MYGGKTVAPGDVIFVFASEDDGGLVARGVVADAYAVPRVPGVPRQTPRVDIAIRCTDFAIRNLGREQLKPFADWDDGRPETELNFKFYRQATHKIVGISPAATDFLNGFF